jgi:hypothetical protein
VDDGILAGATFQDVEAGPGDQDIVAVVAQETIGVLPAVADAGSVAGAPDNPIVTTQPADDGLPLEGGEDVRLSRAEQQLAGARAVDRRHGPCPHCLPRALVARRLRLPAGRGSP